MSGQHIDPGSTVYFHPDRVSTPHATLFDPEYWRSLGAIHKTPGGRGASWFIRTESGCEWVLRQYRRGGLVRHLNRDNFLYSGNARTRPAREWRILEYLESRDLPAPRPVAARFVKRGLSYQADIITERIPDTRSLSTLLGSQALSEDGWQAIGACICQFHDAGVCHGDLNAHNILLNDESAVWLIDFDKARIRQPGSWQQGNLARLARSLKKLKTQSASFHYQISHWKALEMGYKLNKQLKENT